MDKLSFIKMLLQNRSLSINDRKRLIVLATKEIEEKQANIISPTEKEEPLAAQTKHRGLGLIYVKPCILQEFLLRYNQDNILKYTCHSIDDDDDIRIINAGCGVERYNLAKHIELISKRFNDLLENYKTQNPLILRSKMTSLILVYITGKDYQGNLKKWSTSQFKTNWQSEDLKKWGEENPHIIPNPGPNIAQKQQNYGFKLTERNTSYLSDTPVRYLKDLVIYFKALFHIRRDNSLKQILMLQNSKIDSIKEGRVIVDFSPSNFFENIELLTDVDKLIQAYKKIISICSDNQNIKFGEKTLVELGFYEQDEHSYFSIHHTNSQYGKTVRNAIERIGKDQASLIENQINGLCDLFIEADFGGNQYFRINLWDKKKKTERQEIDKMQGVKYIMRF